MFSILPNEVILDHSLTLIETRVLIALYSYRDPKSTRPVWPGRAALSKRCGYHPDVISRTTTALERKGWIRKIRRGKKRTNAYEIVGKSDLTDPVRSKESDATEPVRSDATEPVRSIGTDHRTYQSLPPITPNGSYPQEKSNGRKLSAVEKAAAATARLEARIAADRDAKAGNQPALGTDDPTMGASASKRVGAVRRR